VTSKRHEFSCIEGRLWLTVRSTGGVVCARRFACNTVMRSGAELLADLISGKVTTPFNGVAVGLDPTPASPPYETASLTLTALDGTQALAHSASPLMPANITKEVLQKDLKVRLSISSTIGVDRAVSPDASVDRVMIGEAALGIIADGGETLSVIYNRVTFEPVPKTRGNELSLFWEVDFPYGV
jgi:hypothetical protein